MPQPWVLTDVGLVAATGDTPALVFDSVLRSEPLSTPTAVTPDGDPVFPAAPIRNFRVRDYVDRRGLKSVSRSSQLACAAASRLEQGLSAFESSDVGVVLGSAWASIDSIVRFEREAQIEGPRFVDPILFTETVANVPAGQVSIFFGWSGLNATVSAGTSSGLEALIRAVDFLDEGRARAVVAGGGDELNRHLLNARHAASDVTANGPVGGEGACLFTIESASDAASRGVSILGALGAGASRVFTDVDGAEIRSAVALLRDVLRRDRLSTSDIDLLILSCNGDVNRDAVERSVVDQLFEGDAPPAIAPKAILGETWGASVPIGIAIALEAMQRSLVPPRQALRREIRHALILDCSPASHFAGLVVHSEP